VFTGTKDYKKRYKAPGNYCFSLVVSVSFVSCSGCCVYMGVCVHMGCHKTVYAHTARHSVILQ